jgi:hypothetical protein
MKHKALGEREREERKELIIIHFWISRCKNVQELREERGKEVFYWDKTTSLYLYKRTATN